MHLSVKNLILSEDWSSVGDFYAIEKFEWLFLFLLSPMWLVVKAFATIGINIHKLIKDWPWFFIRFAVFELVLVTTDIGSDTWQGIKLSL